MKIDIDQDYEERGCKFCEVSSVTYGYSNPREILMTTDYTAISNYWLDNVITVTMNSTPGENYYPNNIPDFSAVANPPAVDPASCSSTGYVYPVCTLTLTDGGYYEVQEKFDGNITFNEGTKLVVHVRAKFKNNEAIDACFEVELDNPLQIDFVFNVVCVSIRGNINDYQSGIVNYQIDVYKTL